MVAGPSILHTITLHATTVARDGRGVLILGPSGAGKSALGLALLAMGCQLVADDRTILTLENGRIVARCPAPLSGFIEARGVGLLNAAPIESTPVALVVDLGTPEHDRLPPFRSVTLLDHALPLLHNPATGHFAAAVLQYLVAGRRS